MTDVVLFPDVRTVVRTWLLEQLPQFGPGAVDVVSEVPKPRPARFVVLTRTGGPAATLVSDAAQLTLDVYGPTDVDAHDLAQLVRGLLRSARGRTIAGVRVYRVDELAGPQDFPDPDSGTPRWTWSAVVQLRGAVVQPSP